MVALFSVPGTCLGWAVVRGMQKGDTPLLCVPLATAFLGRVLGAGTGAGYQAAITFLVVLSNSHGGKGSAPCELVARLTKHIRTSEKVPHVLCPLVDRTPKNRSDSSSLNYFYIQCMHSYENS